MSRGDHATAWTGSRMIVFGGVFKWHDFAPAEGGGSYDPIANTWAPISVVGAPTVTEVVGATGLWADSYMVVLNGSTLWGKYSPAPTSGHPWRRRLTPAGR